MAAKMQGRARRPSPPAFPDRNSHCEARGQAELDRLRIVAPFVIGGDDRTVRQLLHARIADMLIDARVLPVDAALADLAARGRHAARARRLRRRLAGHAALADDELV